MPEPLVMQSKQVFNASLRALRQSVRLILISFDSALTPRETVEVHLQIYHQPPAAPTLKDFQVAQEQRPSMTAAVAVPVLPASHV